MNNLSLYPAKELTDPEFKQCLEVAQELYAQGVYGYVEIQMMCYTDSSSAKKGRRVEFVGIECRLNPCSSAYFMIEWMFGSLSQNHFLKNVKERQVLYCPFVDNNGFKCDNLR